MIYGHANHTNLRLMYTDLSSCASSVGCHPLTLSLYDLLRRWWVHSRPGLTALRFVTATVYSIVHDLAFCVTIPWT